MGKSSRGDTVTRRKGGYIDLETLLVRGYGGQVERLGERAILKAVKAARAVSRRVAEIAAKDKKRVRLNPDLIKFPLRSLRL